MILKVFILSDSLGALCSLFGTLKQKKGQNHLVSQITHLLRTWSGQVLIEWVPGHTNIQGNDLADRTVKAALYSFPFFVI